MGRDDHEDHDAWSVITRGLGASPRAPRLRGERNVKFGKIASVEGFTGQPNTLANRTPLIFPYILSLLKLFAYKLIVMFLSSNCRGKGLYITNFVVKLHEQV